MSIPKLQPTTVTGLSVLAAIGSALVVLFMTRDQHMAMATGAVVLGALHVAVPDNTLSVDQLAALMRISAADAMQGPAGVTQLRPLAPAFWANGQADAAASGAASGAVEQAGAASGGVCLKSCILGLFVAAGLAAGLAGCANAPAAIDEASAAVAANQVAAQAALKNAADLYGIAKGIAEVAMVADPIQAPKIAAALVVSDAIAAQLPGLLSAGTMDVQLALALAKQLTEQANALTLQVAPLIKAVPSALKAAAAK